MATSISSRHGPQLSLQCGAAGQIATPALLGWRERLLNALSQIRWPRASSAVEAVPVGYQALGGLDEYLLADIGAPEHLRERARRCHDLQLQRVIDLEHGHRSLGDGRW
jgi:hypothetical protein